VDDSSGVLDSPPDGRPKLEAVLALFWLDEKSEQERLCRITPLL